MSDESKYEAYRIAGELYGRLRELLGFGELAMIVKERVCFQWEVRYRECKRRHEFSIDFHELVGLYELKGRHIEHIAMKVARDWKPNMRTEQSAASGGME